ncbi:hypothetical protein MTR_0004s0190 [Medicago truncatula]|uniref:COG complex component COG2 C-terminal domain-containing protein n=1 Tax=Medicago truncatula TaxID=3880 RepID=A0A072TL73_MEDTR|nr:hypothetical protein MTR_0004s0190 [Medicago truncatula]
MKQWNWKLQEYFALRFQEIAGSLDSVLTTSSHVSVQNLDPGEVNYQDLTLKSSVTLLESLRLCWREENGCVVAYWQDSKVARYGERYQRNSRGEGKGLAWRAMKIITREARIIARRGER